MKIFAIVLSLTALNLAAALQAVTCTPVSATLCVGVDDYADLWINGQCVGTVCVDDFAYVDGASATPIPCVSINPALLNASGNYIAVRVRNTAPTEMWGTWALDITCAGGFHAYSTSSDNFEFYHDAGGTTPPPVESGLPWTDPAYIPSTPWGAPSTVTGSVYGKRATDPQTGALLPPRSWNSSGSGTATNVMYFRQGFGLTPVPTPVPPNMTVSISSPSCAMQNGANFDLVIRVCNSGGNVTGTTQVVLTRDPEVAFNGPWSSSPHTITQSGNDTIISIPTFPGSSCVDYTIIGVDYYIGPAEVDTIRNFSVALTYPGGSDSTGMSMPAVNCVAMSPTITRTFTLTPAATATFTAAPDTPTSTASPTATLTATIPPSPTITATPTVTGTYSPAPTPPPPTATPEPLLLTPKHPNPSPAKDHVFIPYVLSTAATVDIRIYDVSGEKVLDLGPVFQSSGAQERRWELRNTGGTAVSSGVYLCRILAKSPQGEEDDAWVKVAVSR